MDDKRRNKIFQLKVPKMHLQRIKMSIRVYVHLLNVQEWLLHYLYEYPVLVKKELNSSWLDKGISAYLVLSEYIQVGMLYLLMNDQIKDEVPKLLT
jgi:hypothetical protein